MFQSLTQGTTIPILYKDIPRVVDAKVVSVNTHVQYNPAQPMAQLLNGLVTDLTVQVDNDSIPFMSLPATGVSANFPDKGIFISTDKTAINRELEGLIASHRKAIEELPERQKKLKACEELYAQHNPSARESAHQEKAFATLSEEVTSLKKQAEETSAKLDRIMEFVSSGKALKLKKDE